MSLIHRWLLITALLTLGGWPILAYAQGVTLVEVEGVVYGDINGNGVGEPEEILSGTALSLYPATSPDAITLTADEAGHFAVGVPAGEVAVLVTVPGDVWWHSEEPLLWRVGEQASYDVLLVPGYPLVAPRALEPSSNSQVYSTVHFAWQAPQSEDNTYPTAYTLKVQPLEGTEAGIVQPVLALSTQPIVTASLALAPGLYTWSVIQQTTHPGEYVANVAEVAFEVVGNEVDIVRPTTPYSVTMLPPLKAPSFAVDTLPGANGIQSEVGGPNWEGGVRASLLVIAGIVLLWGGRWLWKRHTGWRPRGGTGPT